MARTFANSPVNYDWATLGESLINDDYQVVVSNNTVQAVKFVNGKRVGTLCCWSGFHHWEHGDQLNTAVTYRSRMVAFDPYRGRKLAIVLLSKGQNLDLDPKAVEAVLDTFNLRVFEINGPEMEPEKCRVLQELGIDPFATIPNPRVNDREDIAMVPTHQAFKICYVIK